MAKITLTSKEIEVAMSHLTSLKFIYDANPKHYGEGFLANIQNMTNKIVKAIKDGSHTIDITPKLAKFIGTQFAMFWQCYGDEENFPPKPWTTLAVKICNEANLTVEDEGKDPFYGLYDFYFTMDHETAEDEKSYWSYDDDTEDNFLDLMGL